MRPKKLTRKPLEQLKEKNWGYFRPGFYPVQDDSIVPAMICLGEKSYSTDHNVQFILVKTDCYLNDWEDALLVSEKDFKQITGHFEESQQKKENISEKIHFLTEKFMSKGYLPLSKINPDMQLNSLH